MPPAPHPRRRRDCASANAPDCARRRAGARPTLRNGSPQTSRCSSLCCLYRDPAVLFLRQTGGRRLTLCASGRCNTGHALALFPTSWFRRGGNIRGRTEVLHRIAPSFSREESSMKQPIDRREFLKLAGLGSVVFASSLGAARAAGTMAAAKGGTYDDFYFVQLSDTHWGFEGPPNPDAKGTLKKTVAAVNSLSQQPDFIVFTGDLTHTTDDPKVRRQRLTQFKEIVSELKVKDVRFMPGEHDASLDRGEAYQEFFGKTHYTFDHKGVHFIALDNVSDRRALIGDEQLQWLPAGPKTQPPEPH